MPARLLVKDETTTTERPPEDLSELRDRPCWLDIADPQSRDLELAANELGLHPLAVEDAQQRHERPKIDQYEDHYFIVFYALEETSPDVVREIEVSIFVKHNAIVTVHEGEFAVRVAVEKRFREGKLQTTGLLLHALLDTMVDGYFKVIDGLGDRVELLEQLVVGGDARDYDTSIRELFVLKRDLLRIRHLIAPERDVLAVLVRGDIQELRETGRRAYFQDVYDHITRVTDEIDTFRELTSNVIDAHLASVSNRLNEVMKVLTSVATVLLILAVVTGFFGQNWEFIPYGSIELFWASMLIMVGLALAVAYYFRRKGWL
ncbi:MAG TPA: magnesium/cobalt transporter CorA [Candidatus Limnocylindria bacterium]|jgi:magnesium transporter|nr:magnesium/cobalt transporter CorA [Candidatus Limnocylindria bacterium]